jgi:xanthosine utilization system XapX-like protein
MAVTVTLLVGACAAPTAGAMTAGQCIRLTTARASDGRDASGAGVLMVLVDAPACRLDHVSVDVRTPDGTHRTLAAQRLRRHEQRAWSVTLTRGDRDVAVFARADTPYGPGAAETVLAAGPGLARRGAIVDTNVALAILGVLGTLLGAGLAEYYARIRTKRAEKVAWSTTIFQEHVAAYVRFFGAWGGSTDPNVLTSARDQLGREAIVPERMSNLLNSGVDRLTAATAPAERRAVVSDVQTRLTALLTDPAAFAG